MLRKDLHRGAPATEEHSLPQNRIFSKSTTVSCWCPLNRLYCESARNAPPGAHSEGLTQNAAASALLEILEQIIWCRGLSFAFARYLAATLVSTHSRQVAPKTIFRQCYMSPGGQKSSRIYPWFDSSCKVLELLSYHRAPGPSVL